MAAHPVIHALDSLLDILDRVCYAETQVAFAKVTESCAGERGNTGFLEQRIG